MKSAFAGIVGVVVVVLASAGSMLAAEPGLKCKADGTFKILVMSDLHTEASLEDAETAATLVLMEKLLKIEKPDLVVLNGDLAMGELNQRKGSVAQLANPLVKAQVPWAITMGNHDSELPDGSSFNRTESMSFYESQPHNLNSGWVRGITGVGNKNLLIFDAEGKKPVFNVWLVDSNSTQPVGDLGYDWIHTDQVLWYYQTSKALEEKYGARIPSLMFFHIPLLEFVQAANAVKLTGQKRERESTSGMNSGLFAAVFERGDVRGIFCGHDHTNNYVGVWRGIQFGFDGTAGYHGYPHLKLDDPKNGRARSCRVFVIRQSDAAHYKTYLRFADGSTEG